MDKELKVDFVWGNVSENLADEVVTFWLSQGALTDRKSAKERTKELSAICRNPNGELIGVTTLVKYFHPPLQNHFLTSRTFIKENARNLGLRIKLFNRVWSEINESQLYEKEGVVGILAVLENRYLNAKTDAVWTELRNAVLVGFDNRGLQIRVSYFPDAKILTPTNSEKD